MGARRVRARNVPERFRDRRDAGRVLAQRLTRYAGANVTVLCLPRGGVPVGYEIATALGAPLDVFVVRKLGVPGHEELAMGAIAPGDVRILNDDVVASGAITERDIAVVAARESKELERRERLYRGERPTVEVAGRTAILVDDGLATGSTMRAAVAAVQAHRPASVVVAVPVGAAETCRALERDADEVVCALMPERMGAISLWYDEFSQTTDDEVRALLGTAERDRPEAAER